MMLRGLSGLAFVASVTLSTACDVLKEEHEDKTSQGAESGDSKKADKKEAAVDRGAGQVSLVMPEGGEFDQVVVRVSSLGRCGWYDGGPEPMVPQWDEQRPMPSEWDDEEQGPDDVDAVDEAVALHYGKPRFEDREIGDGEHDWTGAVDHDMSWDGPHHPPFDTCALMVESYHDYEAGKTLLLDGVPLGPVLVEVELMKNGAIIEAGNAKAFVTPHAVASVQVQVYPVAGSLEVKIVRFGEDGFARPGEDEDEAPSEDYDDDDAPQLKPQAPVQTAAAN